MSRSKGVYLNSRDRAIFYELFKTGAMTTDQIHALFFSELTLRLAQQRTKSLAAAGYLKITPQADFVSNLVGLGPKSVDEIVDTYGPPEQLVRKRIRRPTADKHQLRLNDYGIATTKACILSPNVDLISFEWDYEIKQAAEGNFLTEEIDPTLFQVQIENPKTGKKENVRVEPDAAKVLGIHRDDRIPRVLFLVEIDRNSEPYEPTKWERANILKKLRGLRALLNDRSETRTVTHRETGEQRQIKISKLLKHYDASRAYVLFATNGETRRDGMIRTLQRDVKRTETHHDGKTYKLLGDRRIWFTTFDQYSIYDPEPLLHSPIWHVGEKYKAEGEKEYTQRRPTSLIFSQSKRQDFDPTLAL